MKLCTRLFLVSMIVLIQNSIKAQDWVSSFDTAKEIAASEDKQIVLVFAGSDWCAPCMKLERYILETEEFKNYAKEHYVLYKADFPRKKKNQLPADQQKVNESLAAQYNRQGIFPLVVLLDAQGNRKGETGYIKVGPSEYIKHLTTL